MANNTHHIEGLIDLVIRNNSDAFEKLLCPKCGNPALVASIPTTEHSNQPVSLNYKGKTPKIKRIRGELGCPYCGFECKGEKELRKYGIEAVVESDI